MPDQVKTGDETAMAMKQPVKTRKVKAQKNEDQYPRVIVNFFIFSLAIIKKNKFMKKYLFLCTIFFGR